MMQRAIFKISKMDCPSEENLIRMKLDEVDGIIKLDFNIEERKLAIYHNGDLEEIKRSIHSLDLNEKFLSTETVPNIEDDENQGQRKLLWAVLSINFAFFLIEMLTGLLSKSMGLVADSLDMLADSFVYGLSLFAVGGTIVRKKKIAKLAGYFQMILACIGFIEVLRRFFGFENLPDFSTMIIVSIFALIGNGTCLYLLQRSKSREAHMRASMIFTSNDVIINLGVILAGIMVNVLNSNKPDLIIGSIVFILVVQGAVRILKLGK